MDLNEMLQKIKFDIPHLQGVVFCIGKGLSICWRPSTEVVHVRRCSAAQHISGMTL